MTRGMTNRGAGDVCRPVCGFEAERKSVRLAKGAFACAGRHAGLSGRGHGHVDAAVHALPGGDSPRAGNASACVHGALRDGGRLLLPRDGEAPLAPVYAFAICAAALFMLLGVIPGAKKREVSDHAG